MKPNPTPEGETMEAMNSQAGRSDEQRVKEVYPDAQCVPIPNNGWHVFSSAKNRIEHYIGGDNTEAEAWADAASRLPKAEAAPVIISDTQAFSLGHNDDLAPPVEEGEVTPLHELKTWPEFFRAIKEGRKKYEIRKNDRGFHVGDLLRLNEYDPAQGYTGERLDAEVTYITEGGSWGLPEDICVLSIVPASSPVVAGGESETDRLRKERDGWRRKYFEIERALSGAIDKNGEQTKRIQWLEGEKDRIRADCRAGHIERHGQHCCGAFHDLLGPCPVGSPLIKDVRGKE